MTEVRDFPDDTQPSNQVNTVSTFEAAGTIVTGSIDLLGLDSNQSGAAVILTGPLPAGCAAFMGATVPGSADHLDRGMINLAAADFDLVLPCGSLGAGVLIGLVNLSGVNWDFDLFVQSFAGVAQSLTMPAQVVESFHAIAVPGLGASPIIDLRRSTAYERVTLTLLCTKAATVTIRRSAVKFVPPYAIVTFDELAATLVANVPQTVDVPVGTDGFALIFTGTGVTAGLGTIVARSYRAQGF